MTNLLAKESGGGDSEYNWGNQDATPTVSSKQSKKSLEKMEQENLQPQQIEPSIIKVEYKDEPIQGEYMFL